MLHTVEKSFKVFKFGNPTSQKRLYKKPIKFRAFPDNSQQRDWRCSKDSRWCCTFSVAGLRLQLSCAPVLVQGSKFRGKLVGIESLRHSLRRWL